MIKKSASLKENLYVGIIQTDLDANVAWANASKGIFEMNDYEAERSWSQIKSAFIQMREALTVPDIIVLPELSIPKTYVNRLRQFARSMGSIVVAGIDYETTFTPNRTVKNSAIVLIPPTLKSIGRLKGPRSHGGGAQKFVGKIYPAPLEIKVLDDAGFQFISDNVIWLFESASLGTFGVTICYDLMDLERALMYKDRIHHLFVLAYNKDINSFYHLAEAMCRTIYCNVVICNTGFYGGSLAVKPYNTSWERTVYRHEGGNLNTMQIVQLPIKSLDNAQRGVLVDGFKNPPPSSKHSLKKTSTAILK